VRAPGDSCVGAGHGLASTALTTYLWTTKTGVSAETPTGETVEAELSFSDALKDLDFAFMGAFEARKGKLSLFTDAMYFKLSPNEYYPRPADDSVSGQDPDDGDQRLCRLPRL
jgi:hypothetical protein